MCFFISIFICKQNIELPGFCCFGNQQIDKNVVWTLCAVYVFDSNNGIGNFRNKTANTIFFHQKLYFGVLKSYPPMRRFNNFQSCVGNRNVLSRRLWMFLFTSDERK